MLASSRAEAARLLATRDAGTADARRAGLEASRTLPADCSTEECRLRECSRACVRWMASPEGVPGLDTEARKRAQFTCLGGCLEGATSPATGGASGTP